MKNQYFGDVGDYGKYGLFRFLATHGIHIAVNWYLTPDDGSNDGKHIRYLDKASERIYDPPLFDLLNHMVRASVRDVTAFEEMNMIPGAAYYHAPLDLSQGRNRQAKRVLRERWHRDGLAAARGAELVFLDPDNGLAKQEPKAMRESVKYVYAAEAADYFNAGHNVVYYCQKGRRTSEQWDAAKNLLREFVPGAGLCATSFHRGTQRTYVFAIHEEQYECYQAILKEFLRSPWNNLFTWEPVEYGA